MRGSKDRAIVLCDDEDVDNIVRLVNIIIPGTAARGQVLLTGIGEGSWTVTMKDKVYTSPKSCVIIDHMDSRFDRILNGYIIVVKSETETHYSCMIGRPSDDGATSASYGDVAIIGDTITVGSSTKKHRHRKKEILAEYDPRLVELALKSSAKVHIGSTVGDTYFGNIVGAISRTGYIMTAVDDTYITYAIYPVRDILCLQLMIYTSHILYPKRDTA